MLFPKNPHFPMLGARSCFLTTHPSTYPNADKHTPHETKEEAAKKPGHGFFRLGLVFVSPSPAGPVRKRFEKRKNPCETREWGNDGGERGREGGRWERESEEEGDGMGMCQKKKAGGEAVGRLEFLSESTRDEIRWEG